MNGNGLRMASRSLLATTLIGAMALSTACSTFKSAPKEPSYAEMIRGEDTRNAALVRRNMVKGNDRSQERGALGLGRIGNPSDRGRLIAMLKEPNPRLRAVAAFALGEIFDKGTRESYGGRPVPEVSAALLAAFGDTDKEVQATIADALGKIGDPVAIQELLTRIAAPQQQRDRSNERVAEAAMTALMRIGSADASDGLEEMTLSPNPRLRFVAANSLVRLPGKDGRDAALRLVKDEFPEVRAIGVRLLGDAGLPEDAIPLFDLKSDSAFAVFIEMLRAEAALQNPDFPRILRPALDSIAERALKDSKAAQMDGRFVNIATTALTAIAKFDPQPGTLDLLQNLRALDNPIGYSANFAYASALRRSNSKAKFSDFPSSYSVQSAAGMRAAITAWEELGPERAFAELPRMPFAKLGRIHVEEFAGEAESLTDIERASLPTFVDAWGRLYLKQSGGEYLDQFILYHLWSDDPLVRATAAELLKPEDPKVDPPFRFLQAVAEVLAWDQDANPDGRRAMVELLGRFPELNTDRQAGLTRALNDPSRDVRAAAMKALNRGSDADFQTYLADTPGSWRSISPEESREGFYQRIARSQGKRIVVTMEIVGHGRIAVELYPSEAPITTENFLRLARKGYFDGLSFHRVVPNFVIQGGDPRNDMAGGPGYSIPCEVNSRKYRRGTLGMALSGKDTGGSQFFIALAPQPHLDGGYTVFGQVLTADQAAEYSPELAHDVLDLEVLDEISQYSIIEKARYIVPGPPVTQQPTPTPAEGQ